jgi:hypothetical protein
MQDESFKDYAIDLMVKAITQKAKPPCKEACREMGNLYLDAGNYDSALYFYDAYWDYKNWVKKEWPHNHTHRILSTYCFD